MFRSSASCATPPTLLGPSRAPLGSLLGASRALLGRSWLLLGRSWGALKALLGALGPLLGRSWAALGALGWSPGALGRSRGALGTFWGRSGLLLALSWAALRLEICSKIWSKICRHFCFRSSTGAFLPPARGGCAKHSEYYMDRTEAGSKKETSLAEFPAVRATWRP